MRNRALGPIATLLSLLLVTTTTVQAGPISVSEVVQVVGRYQSTGRGPDLRLRNVSPDTSLSDKSSTSSSVSSSPSTAGVLDTSTAGAPPTADSLLAGVTLSSDDSQGTLDVISQGDLEGSICDCGEIPGVEENGHGLPKWPLLFLAAIPFFFIHHHCDTCDNKIPPPTPTPPPGVPEPASLLLMGSGLAAIAARLRRRHARKSALAQAIASTEEA